MKKTLQLFLTIVFTVAFAFKGLACDPPTNLRSLVEQDVPGYGYTYRVTLNWDAVDDGDFYSVYFYSDNYPDGMWLGDTDGLYYVAGANTEAVFYFAVEAHCSDGSSSGQSQQCAVVIQNDATPCRIPENFDATVEEDLPNAEYKYTITLTWDAVENAEKYELYVNGDMFTYTTETTYVTGTDTPQELYFAIATVCEDGSESIVSPNIYLNIDPCMPPTNLQATVEQDVPGFNHKYKVTLTWDENPDASSYTIYENGEWKSYSTTNSFEIGYDSPTTIFYNVTSSCINGESEMSEPLSVTVGGTDGPCLAPVNLGAIVEQDVDGYEYKFKVTLTWDAADGAEAYIVYVNGQELGASSTNLYIVGSDVETVFSYTVVSICANGESEESEPYTVAVEETSLEEYADKFDVYPNPANDFVRLSSAAIRISVVEVYNVVGMLIDEIEVDANEVEINVSDYNPGVYFITVNTEKGNIVKRFVKE
ncbi:MAG: T9SS type A sorting domain-containing protein [Bacteroidales bacterium]|nr:T9SS type A sorting domain-containing protein [Bacteroidales bacterium]